MTTLIEFILNGIQYNEINGRYYKTEDGKKTRISKAAYEEAAATFVEETNKTKVNNKPAKPAKKARKSKDIAFSMHIVTEDNPEETDANLVTLTAKQVDFMKHLPDTCFWEHGLDSAIWIDCLCDEIGGQFKNKPMTVGAMISTLCEKGVGARFPGKVGNHKAMAFELTEIGKIIAAELGIE